MIGENWCNDSDYGEMILVQRAEKGATTQNQGNCHKLHFNSIFSHGKTFLGYKIINNNNKK